MATFTEHELSGFLGLGEANERDPDLVADDFVVGATEFADQPAMLLEIGPGPFGQSIAGLDVDTQQIATRPPGNAGGPPNERLVGGMPRDGYHHPLARLPRAVHDVRGEVVVQALPDPVGHP